MGGFHGAILHQVAACVAQEAVAFMVLSFLVIHGGGLQWGALGHRVLGLPLECRRTTHTCSAISGSV
jgi:hypothetical protein